MTGPVQLCGSRHPPLAPPVSLRCQRRRSAVARALVVELNRMTNQKSIVERSFVGCYWESRRDQVVIPHSVFGQRKKTSNYCTDEKNPPCVF